MFFKPYKGMEQVVGKYFLWSWQVRRNWKSCVDVSAKCFSQGSTTVKKKINFFFIRLHPTRVNDPGRQVPIFKPNKTTGLTALEIPRRIGSVVKTYILWSVLNPSDSEAIYETVLADSVCHTRRFGPVSFETQNSYSRFADHCTSLKKAKNWDDYTS